MRLIKQPYSLLFMESIMPETLPQDWVIIRLSALGDVALTTGVLSWWQQKHGWRFTVITRETCAPILERHPAITQVIGLRKEELYFPCLTGRLRALSTKFAGWGLIDLHGALRTRLLSALWKGPVRRYDKLGLQRRLFLYGGKKWYQDSLLQLNVPQRYALACEATPPAVHELRPQIFLSCAEQEQGQFLLTKSTQRKPRQPVIALHPYATHADKAWPQAYWQKLIALLEAENLSWIVIGQGNPLPGIPGEWDFTNKTTLRETCALLQAAAVLVTGDSGPMHLAAGVKTPVVALFGPTTREWGFYPTAPKDIILESDLCCRPCTLHGEKKCRRDQACMKAITPEQVLKALKTSF